MVNEKYAKAYKEVLEIIKYFPEEEYNKIPKEKIAFFEENMDKEYEFTIDPAIDLAEQNVSREAKAVIVTLFQDYFATEEQKIKINKILELNEREAEEEKRKKYNPDDLFKKNKDIKEKESNEEENIESENKETSLVEYKESFFAKIKNFILKFFHLNA